MTISVEALVRIVLPTLSFSDASACLAASSARISSRCLKLEMSRSAMCAVSLGSCSVMICRVWFRVGGWLGKWGFNIYRTGAPSRVKSSHGSLHPTTTHVLAREGLPRHEVRPVLPLHVELLHRVPRVHVPRRLHRHHLGVVSELLQVTRCGRCGWVNCVRTAGPRTPKTPSHGMAPPDGRTDLEGDGAVPLPLLVLVHRQPDDVLGRHGLARDGALLVLWWWWWWWWGWGWG